MKEELEELEDLPAISLDSSVTDWSTSFEMPDARTIARQRKLELELDEEIKRTKEDLPLDPIEEQIPNELASELMTLKENISEMTMPIENPGIELRELNLMSVIDKFEGPRALFLSELTAPLLECDDKDLKIILAWFLDSIERCIVEGADSFEIEDIHCNVVALALLSMDKRCRYLTDDTRMHSLMVGLLNRVRPQHQSQILLNDISNHLLQLVTHFHDRLVLADSFHVANVSLHELSRSEYFSCKLAKIITHATLSQMLGHQSPHPNEGFTVMDLKEMVMNGSRWHLLSPYEQYYCLVFIVNLLLRYTVIGKSDSQNESDVETLNEMLQFVSNVKSNNNRTCGYFLKVKNLITKIKLLIQSKQGKDSGSKDKELIGDKDSSDSN